MAFRVLKSELKTLTPGENGRRTRDGLMASRGTRTEWYTRKHVSAETLSVNKSEKKESKVNLCTDFIITYLLWGAKIEFYIVFDMVLNNCIISHAVKMSGLTKVL